LKEFAIGRAFKVRRANTRQLIDSQQRISNDMFARNDDLERKRSRKKTKNAWFLERENDMRS